RLVQEIPDVPAWISFSCGDGRHLCHGERFADAVAVVDSCPNALAVGVNCTAPRHVEELLLSAQGRTRKPLLAYPNSGEQWSAERHAWEATRDSCDWGAAARAWHGAGALLIGGCCRTTPE